MTRKELIEIIKEEISHLINEEGLKAWFDDADGDGQKGWVQAGGKYDGKHHWMFLRL